jgi:hypothetical protein
VIERSRQKNYGQLKTGALNFFYCSNDPNLNCKSGSRAIDGSIRIAAIRSIDLKMKISRHTVPRRQSLGRWRCRRH